MRNKAVADMIPGAIIGYAKCDDIGVWRELCLMLATGCRPGVALAFVPGDQWLDDVIDLQPVGKKLEDKRNAIVPTIEPMKPILKAWQANPHHRVAGRKTWGSTAHRTLRLRDDIVAYDIRHTVTTYMDDQRVPGAQMSGIVGHLPSDRGIAKTTKTYYLHYNPHNARQAKRVLTKLFDAVSKEADRWIADHSLTNGQRGCPKQALKISE
ncbi:site-specific integrase [Novosphingobium sp. BW1]|nr:site-specific integrase [Novosphingobium sp. BW1]